MREVMTRHILNETEFIKAGVCEAKQITFTDAVSVKNSDHSMTDHRAQQRCVIWDQVTIFCDLCLVLPSYVTYHSFAF